MIQRSCLWVLTIILIEISISHQNKVLKTYPASYFSKSNTALQNHRKLSSRKANQGYYYPSSRLDDEPTCEELRTMWRNSKRALGDSLLTNEIPQNADNFGYIIRSSPSRSSPAFGRILRAPSRKSYQSTLPGSPMDELKAQMRDGIFAENPYKYVGVVHKSPDSRPPPPKHSHFGFGKFVTSKSPKKELKALELTIDSSASGGRKDGFGSKGYDHRYRKPHIGLNHQYSKVDHHWGYGLPEEQKSPPQLLSDDLRDLISNERSTTSWPSSNEEMTSGFNTETKDCSRLSTKKCKTRSDCQCYGLYTCVLGRCKSTSTFATSSGTEREDQQQQWMSRPAMSSEVGTGRTYGEVKM